MNRSIVLFAAFVFVGCSHSGGGRTTPDPEARVPELPLASLVDPTAVGALHIDVGRIQSTSIYQTASAWIELLREEQRQGSDARFLLELLSSREMILYLVAPPNAEPAPVLLLRGDYDDADIERIASESETPPRVRTHGPFTVRDVGEHGSIGRVGRHTLVIGKSWLVDATLDRQLAGGNGHYPDEPAFQALADRVGLGSMPIAFAVIPTEAMRRAGLDELDPILAPIAGSHGIGFGLDPSDGLRGRVVVNLDSNLEAVGVTTLARMQLGRFAEEPEVVATGLSALLPYLELERDGTTVIGNLAAPRDAVERALSTLDGFVRTQAAAH